MTRGEFRDTIYQHASRQAATAKCGPGQNQNLAAGPRALMGSSAMGGVGMSAMPAWIAGAPEAAPCPIGSARC